MKHILRPTALKIRITIFLAIVTFIIYSFSAAIFKISCSYDLYPYTNLHRLLPMEPGAEGNKLFWDWYIWPFVKSPCPIPSQVFFEVFSIKLVFFLVFIIIIYLITSIIINLYGKPKSKKVKK